MKIATWNINGIRARMDYLRLWIAEHEPTVLCLQETKADEESFPQAELEALGYHVSHHGQKAYNGVAVLSREPHELHTVGLPGHKDAGARLLHVVLGGTHVVNVYCPNGKHLEHPDFARKLAWYDALIAYMSEISAPRALVGDFNVVPTENDGWNEEGLRGGIFHTQAERGRYATLLETGLQDIWRDHHPGETAFSWWDYRGGAFRFNRGLRIDFILAGGGLPGQFVDVYIDREGRKKREGLNASDHAPVVATTRLT